MFRKIMIVDDDFVTCELLEELLTPYGSCQIVENGFEALRAFHYAHAKNQPFDLITLDISMPDVDGNTVLEAIREWELAMEFQRDEREVKIIMVTAKTSMKDRLQSLRKGCEVYIAKPIRKELIEDALAELNIT